MERLSVCGVLVAAVMASLTITSTAEGGCRRELGMRSGAITDQQISASSSFSGGWAARFARLDHRFAWRPAQRHRHEWLAVDMGRTTNITGVMTQGHLSYGSPRRPYYLKRFALDFKSQDGEEWTSYKIDGKEVTFEGNNDTETVVTNILPQPVLATAVRFHPAGWHSNGFALRVEILGCSLPAMASSEPPVPIATTALPLPAKTTVEAAVAAEETTVHDHDSSGWTMGYRGATADDDTITVVAGSILGCVVLLIAILVCVLLYKRRKMIGSPETEADHRYDNVISYSRVLEESTLDQSEDGNLEWNNFYESVEGRGNGAEYACIQDNKEDNEKLEVENDLYQSSGI